jgi:hypothetical protein
MRELDPAPERQFGAPGKTGPAVFAFILPRASLGSFTTLMSPKAKTPEAGSRVSAWPISNGASPSLRPWANRDRRDPARHRKFTMGGLNNHSKPEVSILLETGSFYLALTFRASYLAVNR